MTLEERMVRLETEIKELRCAIDALRTRCECGGRH